MNIMNMPKELLKQVSLQKSLKLYLIIFSNMYQDLWFYSTLFK